MSVQHAYPPFFGQLQSELGQEHPLFLCVAARARAQQFEMARLGSVVVTAQLDLNGMLGLRLELFVSIAQR